MALTEKDRLEISRAVAEGVRAGIEAATAAGSGCILSEDARNEVGHFFGMVKDVGGGDYGSGIETMRENQKLMAKFRQTSQKIGGAMVMAVCAAVFAVIAWGAKILWSAAIAGGAK